ncbi:multidrug efflux SMR transporter [Burkholderia sp. LMG 13014]|uniref:DMT family transporter n=1 Tax=Burkholderia sp. LMG 13014 TaxID=2709306 RepID=UPI001964C80E|nr:SMR family transporter [Burkholderia sp. LMG 13014]
MKSYLFLFIAILGEVGATSALKASDGFTKLWPAVFSVVGYGVAFYFLSLTLRSIPIGIAYAIWAGVGIVAMALIGLVAFGQKLDVPAMVGIALILGGVLTINVFSASAHH